MEKFISGPNKFFLFKQSKKAINLIGIVTDFIVKSVKILISVHVLASLRTEKQCPLHFLSQLKLPRYPVK